MAPTGLPLLGLPSSVVLALAVEAGVEAVGEAFVDRAYAPDGRLVPRRLPGAVIHDVDAACERAVRLAVDRKVVAADGSVVPVTAT